MNRIVTQTQEATNVIVPNVQKKPNAEVTPRTPGISRGDQILAMLDDEHRKKKALSLLGGDGRRFDRLKTGFMLSLIQNNLMDCDIASIARAFYTCCEYNLDPSCGFGKVYLIKYHNKGVDEVNAQIGCAGWTDLLMRRTDLISYVDTKIVYDDDEFDAELGNNTWYRHKPNFSPKPDRKLKLTYAVVKFKNGDIKLEIATLKDIEEAMKRSKSAQFSSSPWKTNRDSMAKIVPLRRFKSLALSVTKIDDGFSDWDDLEGNREIEHEPKEVMPCEPVAVREMQVEQQPEQAGATT